MKHIKLFEEFIEEGVNDPGILKAFFMAGGPGSGKSWVATEIFGFPKGGVNSTSYATGLKTVNSDTTFEKMAREAGFTLELGDIKDPDEWERLMAIRNRAKELTQKMQDNYMLGRLGLVIDGTGRDFAKIKSQRERLVELGYDTYMLFVNTSLEVALARNEQRDRSLPEEMVKQMWSDVQNNIGKYQKLFGVNRVLIVDNSTQGETETLRQIEKLIMGELRKPVQNNIGKNWIAANDPTGFGKK
jgi:predicted kinase